MHPLTVLYHNCHGLTGVNKPNLLRLLHDTDASSPDCPLLYALVETGKAEPAVPTGGRWMRQHLPGTENNGQQSGGITIISHASCPTQPLPPPAIVASPLDLHSTAIAVAIVTPHHRAAFLLVVVYIHPDFARGMDGMEAVCAALEVVQSQHAHLPVLVVGDFNARHANWHDSNGPNTAGPSVLARHIDNTGLHIHNQPDMFTRVTTNGSGAATKTIIDLALSSPPELVSAISQQHGAALYANDHIPLTLTLALPERVAPPPPPSSRPRVAWATDRRQLEWQAALPAAMRRHIGPLQPLLDALTQRPVARAHTQASSDAALQQLEEVYGELETAILTASVETVGIRQPNHDRPTPPRWWRPEVGAAYRVHSEAENQLLHISMNGGDTTEAHRTALAAQQRYLDAVALAKQQADTQLANDACGPDPALRAATIRKYQPTRAAPLSGIADATGNMPVSHPQSLNNLCTAFLRSSVPPAPHAGYAYIDAFSDPAVDTTAWDSVDALDAALDSSTRHIRQRRAAQVAASADSDSWSFTAVQVAVQTKRRTKKTSAGPDAVLPLLLPYGGEALYAALAAVYNYSWRHSIIPQAWREANVTALYKGKGARSEPLSYRPISVTSGIVRTFEHLIHERLAQHVGTELANTQFGFRAHHSTSDAILQLLTSLQTLCGTTRRANNHQRGSRKLRCAALFLDIQKAFDRVDHSILLARLHNIGVRGAAWRWIRSFLSHRRTRCIDSQYESAWHNVEYGVPQGCVLSPLLFLVFIDGLVKQVAASKQCSLISTLLYADDGVLGPNLWACRSELGRASVRLDDFEKKYAQQLKAAVAILDRWCDASRMSFGQEKTQIVVFNRGNKKDDDNTHYTDLRLCNFNIGIADSYDYLGLTVSSDLSWTKHIQRVLAKARSAAARITTIALRSDHPHPSILRELVCSYIMPCFDYGIEYWGLSLTDKQRTALQATITRPLRVSLSLPTTTHQHSTLFGFGVPDLLTHTQHKQLLHLFRIARLGTDRSDHPSPTLYRKLITNTKMVSDHHKLVTGKAAGTAPTALYLATAFLPHTLHPASPPPQPAAGPAAQPVPAMKRYPSPSHARQRALAAHNFSAPGPGIHAAPAHYIGHLAQFTVDLQSMCTAAFRATLRTIRRAAARCTWTESHKPNTAAEIDNMTPAQLIHCTTAPVSQCITAEDDLPYPSAPPLHFLQRRHAALTTSQPVLVRRMRLLYGRSYTAATRYRFPSAANVPTATPLCPNFACGLAGHDETVEHLLLHCPLYAAARKRLHDALVLQLPPLPLTLRNILNPPANAGKAAYAALYSATEHFLDCVDATRRLRDLPALDHRPDAPPPIPLAAVPPAHHRPPHRPARSHNSHRRAGQTRPRTAPRALDTG